ncbi:MAG: HAD hydrolase family protein, partial [Clostridia bacterium]|nr:HAD hydrolase family protein [Clostridia bacterium]
ILRDLARKIIAGTDFEAARSWPIGLEFINRESNKGGAVRFLKERTGADLLVTVGDYENDIPMLKEADIGFAVANAIDEVKAAADRVTKATCAEGAVAEIIGEIEKIRRC